MIQSLPGGEPAAAAPRLHRWLQKRLFASQRPEMPVVYNTWFDQFEVLDVPRLRQQLQAAKEVGCEVFVIDAGWYGPQAGDWFAQAGDWREKTDGAFRGAMAAFADEVRAAGLGFGLWMEPERFGPDVPIRRRASRVVSSPDSRPLRGSIWRIRRPTRIFATKSRGWSKPTAWRG